MPLLFASAEYFVFLPLSIDVLELESRISIVGILSSSFIIQSTNATLHLHWMLIQITRDQNNRTKRSKKKKSMKLKFNLSLEHENEIHKSEVK